MRIFERWRMALLRDLHDEIHRHLKAVREDQKHPALDLYMRGQLAGSELALEAVLRLIVRGVPRG